MKKKIVALVTCHNRRELTLSMLEFLFAQKVNSSFSLECCLVDDASTDGTRDAVQDRFPDVNILTGSGHLFWAGGMRFGWSEFVRNQTFDYLLVLNDDVLLYESALQQLIDVEALIRADGCDRSCVVGAFCDPQSGNVAYSGVKRSSFWHPGRFSQVVPTGSPYACDSLNMNFALIARESLDCIGFLSEIYTHAKADFDFGLRLRAAGGQVVLAPDYVGEARRNPVSQGVESPDLSFRERWKRLTGIKGEPLWERAEFYRRHGGCLWMFYWLLPYGRILVQEAISFLIGRNMVKGE
ncbi:MAG: glycosyltransferase [Cyanobacteria bacterium P01_F01_bin.150]